MPTLAANATGQLPTVYCSDENIAVRAGGDYLTLCPGWQQRAYGTDGAFLVGALWTLTSATVNFQSNGLVKGNVISLSKPTTQFHGQAQLFAVDSVLAGAVVLRRMGEALNVGQPPAPAAGLTAVEFTCLSMGPQIEEETFNLNTKWSIDPQVGGRDPASVYDLRVLRRACVLRVLFDRYSAEVRSREGDFFAKWVQIKNELAEAEAVVAIRWGSAGRSQPSTNAFSGRFTR